MGRQITVGRIDLEDAGCVFKTKRDGEWQWTEVELPDGRTIGSACDDCLVFDCRDAHSPNYWMERWLIDKGVPYVWG